MKKCCTIVMISIVMILVLFAVPGSAKKEMVESRTMHSKHWQNEDGSYQAEIYQNPIHVQKDGKWEEADSQIYSLEDDSTKAKTIELLSNPKVYSLKNEGYSHAAVNDKFQLYFSANSNRPVRFDVGDGWISFQPFGGRPAKGMISDNSVYYPGVWDNASLLYVSYEYGLKEVVVLTAPGHPEYFSFRVNLRGFEYQQTEDGSIELLDAAGVIQATIPRGFMEDAAGAFSEDVEIRLEERGNNLLIMLVPDQEWLLAEERVYPILVDPSICYYDYTDVVKDAYVTGYNFDSRHGTEDRLEIGMNKPFASNKVAQHTLIKFDLAGIPAGAKIGEVKAQLYLYREVGNGPASVYVRKITSSWNESTVCWNNRPTESDTYKTYTINNKGTYLFDLNPDWVEEWISNSQTNNGFYLQANENEEDNLKYFFSREARPKFIDWVYSTIHDEYIPIYDYEPEKQPKLTVRYALPPGTPTNLRVDETTGIVTTGSTLYTNRSTVKLKWTVPSGEITGYDIFVNGSKVNTVSVTTAAYTLPLPGEGSYSIRVQALGYYGAKSSLSEPVRVVCDRSVQNITNLTVVPQNYGLSASWNAPVEQLGALTFEVATSLTYSGEKKLIANVGTSTSVSITDLSSQYSYYVWVRAYDRLNNVSQWQASIATSPLPQSAGLRVSSFAEAVNGTPMYKVTLTVTGSDAATYVLRRTPGITTSLTQEIATFTSEALNNNVYVFEDTKNLRKHASYSYDVVTKNVTGTDSSVSSPASTMIPNIRDHILPEVTVRFEPVAWQGEIVDGKTIYTFTSSAESYSIRIPYRDCEGDNLRFILHTKHSTDPNFSSSDVKNQTTTLSNLADGVTDWYLSICEYGSDGKEITDPMLTDPTDPQARMITPLYRLTIDATPPPLADNTFEITDQSKVQLESPLASREVYISNLHVLDNVGGVGIRAVYFWNGLGEPDQFENLSQILSNGKFLPDKAALIEKCDLGVIIPLADLTESIDTLIFPWILEKRTMRLHRVSMKVEDQVGNVVGDGKNGRINRTVHVDEIKPSAPDSCSHTHSAGIGNQKMISFYWEADDPWDDIASFTGRYSVDGGEETAFYVTPTQGTGKDAGRFDLDVTTISPNRPVTITIKTVDAAGWESEGELTYTAYTLPQVGSVELLEGGYHPDMEQHFMQWKLVNSGIASRQELQVKVNGAFDTEHPIQPDTDGIFTHANLTAHGRYTYRLVAYNVCGDPVVSEEWIVTVPNAVPSKPVPLAPIGFGRGTVVFHFTESRDNDPQDLLTYRIFLARGANPDPASYEEVTTPTCEMSGLVDQQLYTWYVSVEDGYGGNVESAKVQFTADTNPPALSVTEPQIPYSRQPSLNVTVVDELSGAEKLTCHAFNLEADGSTPPETGSTGTEITLAKTGDNAWTCILPLNEGKYNYILTAYDRAGNTGLKDFNVWVDRTAPVLSDFALGLAPISGKYYIANGRIPIQFSATDMISQVKGIRYRLVTEPVTDVGEDGEFAEVGLSLPDYTRTLQLHGNTNQAYYLALAAEDWAGNRSSTLCQGPIYFDSTLPELNLTVTGLTISGNSTYVTDLKMVSANAIAADEESPIQTLRYSIRSVETGTSVNTGTTWGSLQNTSLTPGKRYQIGVTATNGAGLVSERQSAVFVFDNTPPMHLNLTAPTTELVPGETALISLSADDSDTPVVQYRLAIGSMKGGTDITSMMTGQVDGWLCFSPVSEYRFLVPDVSDGTYYLTFMAVNAAGLSASNTEASFRVNNQQPKMVVHDQGPYTMVDEQLTGWWNYTGSETVSHYLYRIVDSSNQTILDWRTADTGQTVAIVTGLHLQSGMQYHFEVQAFFTTGTSSNLGRSPGVTVDLTDPVIASLTTPAYSTSANLNFNWVGNDPESGISSVQVALGTDYFATDMTDGWVPVSGNELSRTTKGEPLMLLSGQRYYLTLRVINGAGRQIELAAPGIMIDDTPPPTPEVCDQGNFLNTKQPMQMHWGRTEIDPESEPVQYEWALLEHGETIDSAVWYPGNEAMKVNLDEVEVYHNAAVAAGRQYYQEHGKTYYFAVKATNAAGLSSIGWSDGITADETAPFVANVVLLNAVQIGNPDPHAEVRYINSTQDLALWIQSFEDVSQIQEYYYAWGTRQDVDEEDRQTDLDGTVILDNPTIPEGALTIFAGETKNTADELSATGYSVGVTLDTSAPKIVNVNGAFSGNTLIFDWGVENSNSPVACYEVVLLPASQTNLAALTWTPVGLNTTYTRNVTGLADGKYKLLVRAVNRAGNYSRRDETHDEWGISADVILDRTAPKIKAFVYPEFVANQLELSATGFDETSGVHSYQYALGSLTDQTAYSGQWVDVLESTGLIQLPLDIRSIPDKTVFYVQMRVRDQAGLWSNPALSGAIRVDRTPPTTPVLTVASQHINSTAQIDGIGFSSVDLESGITHYSLGIATSIGGLWFFEQEPKPIGQFDGRITGVTLTNGKVYSISVKTKNAAGVWSMAGYSIPVMVDTSAPELAFARADETIVLNAPPVDVRFTLSENANVEFTLIDFNGVMEKTLEMYEAGEGSYVFNKSARGIYTLRAKVTDLAGNLAASVYEQQIRVNKVPEIILPVVVYTTPAQPLVLEALYVRDPENDLPLKYIWTPGDGGTDVAGEKLEHQYMTPGEYTATLTVTDVCNGVGTATTLVKVVHTDKGTLYSDETWSGEHHIYGDVTVPAGLTLTILPGTTVVIDGTPGITGFDHQLRIEGNLVIQGREGEEVIFRSVIGAIGAWKGIWVTGEATLNGVNVMHALRGLTVVSDARATIAGSTFSNNKVGIHAYGGDPVITDTEFVGNQTYGIKEDLGSAPVLTNCRFSNNGMHYYDEERSRITIPELNTIEGNGGNHEE